MEQYERIILGAGMYGLYAATVSASKGIKTLVIDIEPAPFMRGSYINQARLHNGYHYPRSYTTAKKSALYFDRFMQDFVDCVHTEFTQLYAIASEFSWTNGIQFQKFCDNLGVLCSPINSDLFNPNTIEAAFLTHEYTFDAELLSNKLFNSAKKDGCDFKFGIPIKSIKKDSTTYTVELNDGAEFCAPFLLNATYAGCNQIHEMLGFEALPIKYELCEVILCKAPKGYENFGVTVMDGPFFSLMPFGKTGYHSITSVSRTPHITCYETLPTFDCQSKNPSCTPKCMQNCNLCEHHPKSAFIEMFQMAKKYLKNIKLEPVKSIFTLKPILKSSEIDDSRPTLVRQYSEAPYFYSVFSGKINTMYDLGDIL